MDSNWVAELLAKIKQATDALEALDDHICDRINAQSWDENHSLMSAGNRLYTAKTLLGEAVALLSRNPQGA